jgi:opacity protein-like surface antigen
MSEVLTMYILRTINTLIRASLLAISALAILWASTVQAETYVAGQLGVTMPSITNGLTNVELTGSFIPGSTTSDQALKSSIMYGGKLGHYFKSIPWFGIEGEIYYTTPHIKQQTVEFSGPGGPVGSANLPGVNMSVLTIAPLNLSFRYHKTRLQPYIAVGPGIFVAKIKDPSLTSDNSQSSTKLGLNAQLGLRYYITRNVTVFAEGKYNYVRFNFPETPPGPNFNLFGFDATYSMFHAAFGLSYNF